MDIRIAIAILVLVGLTLSPFVMAAQILIPTP